MSIQSERKILINMTLIMFILSIIGIIFIATYGLYSNFQKGNTTNLIETGIIAFSYNEGESLSNGISLKNSFPVSDEIGKIQNGEHQYFDFTITSSTSLADLYYEVILEKDLTSTMDDGYVKVYLTKVNGNKEVVCNGILDDSGNVKTYDLFDNYKADDKIIYADTIKKGSINYSENFRLRMWIKDGNYTNDSDIFDKFFSVKIRLDATE